MTSLDLKLVGPSGRPPELVAFWRMGVGRTAPKQPLDLARLLTGGALSGPMFECRPGPLGRLWRWLRFVPRQARDEGLGMRVKRWTVR